MAPLTKQHEGGGSPTVKANGVIPSELHFELTRDPASWLRFLGAWQHQYRDYEFAESMDILHEDDKVGVVLRLIQQNKDDE